MTDQNQTPEETTSAEASIEPSQPLDLDAVEKFTFQGQEFSPEKFHETFKEYETLKAESQKWQEEQNYQKNLYYDLEEVKKNPALAEDFKKIYPKSYHGYVDLIVQKEAAKPGQQQKQEQQQSQLPQEVQDQIKFLMNFVQNQQKASHEEKVQSELNLINTTFPELSKKYELADQDAVLAKGEILAEKGMKMTRATWERLFKQSHDEIKKRSDAFFKAQAKLQLEKGEKGLDAGPGGHAPGKAPVKPKTFDEAYAATMEALSNSRRN